MRIISLEVEAFKRLRAVSIAPTGNLVEVSGENGQGKSSTLDAIWAALGGKDACPDKPIHTGEKAAEVRLVLGEGDVPKFKVTRRFKLKDGVAYTTDLTVENAEGAKFSKPQESILNAMMGEYCFDPMAFPRLKDEEQVRALRRFVPEVDFAQIEGLNKRDYDTRTDANRTAKDLRAQAGALPTVEGDRPERVDVDALQAQLADAAEHNSMVEQRRVRRETTVRRLQDIESEIERLKEEKAALETKLAAMPPTPDPVDVQEVSQKLTAGLQTNALLDRIGQREALEARAKAAEEQAMSLTLAIDKRKEQAAKAVAAAKMPVPGLGFAQGADEKPFVTLNGEPFAQASQAEKIRASVAIAAAMNPRLRVARVSDGSLLDKKSWAALGAYADANDLQIWVETIDPKSAAAIVIEDGGVASTSEPHSTVADTDDVI